MVKVGQLIVYKKMPEISSNMSNKQNQSSKSQGCQQHQRPQSHAQDIDTINANAACSAYKSNEGVHTKK